MFQITDFTEARLATLTNRIEKHGDDDVPAVSLGVEITAANTLLDAIDPKVRQSLYMAVEGQDQLPGVEPATPVLRCNSFERHTLGSKFEGWTLEVDDGIDDTKPMMFGGCKVDKLNVEAKQGGSVVLRLRVGTSDLNATRSGFLGMHVGQSVWITLTAPEKQPDAIDASSSATDLPPSASDLFAAGDGDDPSDEDGGPGEEEGSDDEGGVDVDADPSIMAGARAFEEAVKAELVERGVSVETSRPGTRTARGRDKTKRALAEGLKDAAH